MRVFLKINLHILNVSLDNKSIFKENGKIIWKMEKVPFTLKMETNILEILQVFISEIEKKKSNF